MARAATTGWLLLTAMVVTATAVGQESPVRPKNKTPDDTLFKDPAAFCEGCYGMVHEADKLLTMWQNQKGSMEEHIDATLLATCSTDRLRAYVLSPPKMMRLCSGIRAHYEDELGLALLRHFSAKKVEGVDKLFEEVCKKAIPACVNGVQPMSVVRKERMEKAEEERKSKETQQTLENNQEEKKGQEKNKDQEKKKVKGGKKKNATKSKKDEL